jgi:hypothetical protein
MQSVAILVVIEVMAPSTRFERVTYRLGGDCSIQLSYEGVGFRALNNVAAILPNIYSRISNANFKPE